MNRDLIARYGRELAYAAPIEYEHILFYPVKFKNLTLYQSLIPCLLFNPIYYPDMELSSLPRLYFLTECLRHSNNEAFAAQHPEFHALLFKTIGLLSLVLGDQQFDFVETASGRYVIQVQDRNDPNIIYTINSKQFDTIREIILIQNDTFYDDEYVHPDIQKWIDEQKAAEIKRSKATPETIEDKIEALMLEFHQIDEHFLDEMTIRHVNRLFEKMTRRESYNAQITGMMSGMVKFKDDPISWVATQPRRTDLEQYLKELK
ncbi:MAG: hypothetical protein NC084_06220 [Bacteroides sp.]|nr:hypothetical protein [Eubacterium sp.]MCM1418179.1 hypothetical protein [Roseburia sp.]MCM1462296.1 hypothetical protein [Bacteroides sp.]